MAVEASRKLRDSGEFEAGVDMVVLNRQVVLNAQARLCLIWLTCLPREGGICIIISEEVV